MRKFWILFEIHECPVCGSSTTYRERVYDRPKPKWAAQRYKQVVAYDWCDAL